MTETITVKRLFDEWVAANKPTWSANYLKGTLWRNKLINQKWGDHPLHTLKDSEVSEWLANLNYAPTSTRLIKDGFNAACNWGVKTRRIQHNPIEWVQTGAGYTEPTDLPDPEILAQSIANTKDQRWKTIFTLAATTGMRRGEICGLKWTDINLETGRIDVKRNISQERVAGPPKNGRPRHLTVGPKVTGALWAWYERYPDPPEDDAYVFGRSPQDMWRINKWRQASNFQPLPNGQPLHPDEITLAWDLHRRKRTIRFHDLRHHAASQMLAGGIDVIATATRLGQDPVTTLRTYGHAVPARDIEAARILEGLL